MGAQTSGLVGPLPHFSSLALQPPHLLLPPLVSYSVEAAEKMVLRPRAHLSINATHGRRQSGEPEERSQNPDIHSIDGLESVIFMHV